LGQVLGKEMQERGQLQNDTPMISDIASFLKYKCFKILVFGEKNN
jgi:hypothetical protein